jgi:DNA-directed RNA polymerase subunit RPC12/RpoP
MTLIYMVATIQCEECGEELALDLSTNTDIWYGCDITDAAESNGWYHSTYDDESYCPKHRTQQWTCCQCGITWETERPSEDEPMECPDCGSEEIAEV